MHEARKSMTTKTTFMPILRKMAIWWFIPISIAGIASSAFVFCRDQVAGIESWTDLEKDLESICLPKEGFGYDFLMKSRIFQSINQPEQSALWEEMRFQELRPILVAAAFYCIKHHDPTRALSVAFDSLLGRPNDISAVFYDDMFKEIENAAPTDSVFADLDNCARSGVAKNNPNFAVIIDSTSIVTLEKWYAYTDGGRIAPTRLAFVIDRLYKLASRNKVQMTNKMKKQMAAMANCPGIPRMIYVLHNDETEPSFRGAFDCVLGDEDSSLDTPVNVALIRECARKHVLQTKAFLANDKNQISAARRKIIEKSLR